MSDIDYTSENTKMRSEDGIEEILKRSKMIETVSKGKKKKKRKHRQINWDDKRITERHQINKTRPKEISRRVKTNETRKRSTKERK